MKIRPRYAKTLMMAHRRSQSPSLRRANAYNAFVTRQRYGRRPNIFYWHKKRVNLTADGLIKAIKHINNMDAK